jgi:ribosomal protein S27AE
MSSHMADRIECKKCGTAFEPRAWQITCRDRRCLPCKRAQQNATNASKGDALREESRAAYQRRRDYYLNYRPDPQRRAARRKVATEIEAGRLQRCPCEKCGETKSEAHHDDYSKPLDVNWLCRRHHVERHAMLKAREQ